MDRAWAARPFLRSSVKGYCSGKPGEPALVHLRPLPRPVNPAGRCCRSIRQPIVWHPGRLDYRPPRRPTADRGVIGRRDRQAHTPAICKGLTGTVFGTQCPFRLSPLEELTGFAGCDSLALQQNQVSCDALEQEGSRKICGDTPALRQRSIRRGIRAGAEFGPAQNSGRCRIRAGAATAASTQAVRPLSDRSAHHRECVILLRSRRLPVMLCSLGLPLVRRRAKPLLRMARHGSLG